MVAFSATTTFFIFFPEDQCFSKQNTARDQTARDQATVWQALIGKREIQFYTICSLVFRKNVSTSIIFSDEEYVQFLDKYQNLCCRSNYPALYSIELISRSIFTDLNAILYSGFMDVISRLPPPGGTIALDIFRTVLIISYHLPSRFMREVQNFSSPSLRVDIIFDADFEAVFDESVLEFRNFLLWHLKRIFRRNHCDVHTLSIKKGSIGITFFISLVNCVHSKKFGNRCTFTNRGHLQEGQSKISYEKGVIEVACDETEFLGFLRYMKYYISFKHDNMLGRVPYSAKISSHEKSEALTDKLNFLDTKINLIAILRTGNFVPKTFSNSQSVKGKHGNVPDEKPKMDKKENLPVEYFGYKNLHLDRIRRYVAREDESVMKLKVEFKLEKAAKNGNQNKFQRHLVSQLAKAMRVPIPSIKDMKITSETDVSFTLSAFNDENNVMDDMNVVEAADSLKAKIRSQKLRLRDLNGQLLMTAGSAYASVDESSDYSLVILIILCITLLILTILIITVIYIARRTSQIPKSSSNRRNEAYKNVHFGRDSSQSIGKYSYDSGLWLGPGPEPNFTVPEAPYYRPPTVEQITSTPRPATAVRTRLKRNWNVDERALSTIPDAFGRNYVAPESPRR